MSEGWIKWSGGDQPVDGDVVVEVEFRSGVTDKDRAYCWYWMDDGDDCDIVAYRVVSA